MNPLSRLNWLKLAFALTFTAILLASSLVTCGGGISGSGSIQRFHNIVLNDIKGTECHDLSPFIDKNPKATPEGKYKAVSYGHAYKPRGLWAFQSPDGVRWTAMQDGPVYTQGVFDTQNIAYWSEQEGRYVMYYRVFVDGVRHIERAVSDDFINFQIH